MQRNAALHSNLQEIRRRFAEAKIDWIIFAGAAAACYGSNREVTDIDILLRCEGTEKARLLLEDVDLEGFDIGCGAELKIEQETHPFFLDDEMIKRARRKRLFGVAVPVMSVEDNIVLKAILQRGQDQKKHDVEDIKSMITHEKIDLQYLKDRILRCHAEKRVRAILQPLMPTLYEARN